jgi:aspartyl-tRNA(Asn)/glutamyl-tRNA(Gln) amidotransferase subunit A
MLVPPEIAVFTLSELGRGLRRGDFTSAELTETCLARCDTTGRRLNAIVTLTAELAREQARRADDELTAGHDRGPLHGIPFGVKDLLATRGHPTTWGAAPFANRVIDRDSFIVEQLREAGAVLVAKLAMVELAGGLGYEQAHASFTGPGLNPWDATRWSGGSSSGPGSAVGAGCVPFAIGSETWGSILTPSCLCGVTGLRPTYGRVSRRGAMALSWTMDKLGPMARSAEDCELVLNVISARDPLDASQVDPPPATAAESERPSRPRIATLLGATERAQPEVVASFEQSLGVLSEFCDLVETSLPEGLPYNTTAEVIISAEAAAAFEELVISGEIEQMTAEEDRWKLRSHLMIPAVTYIRALRVRRKIQVVLDDWLREFDAIVVPAMNTVAGPIDQMFHVWAEGFSSTQLSGAANVAGLPAIGLPNGLGAGDLPTGLELVGRAFSESVLLEIGKEYQRRTNWHRNVPNAG